MRRPRPLHRQITGRPKPLAASLPAAYATALARSEGPSYASVQAAADLTGMSPGRILEHVLAGRVRKIKVRGGLSVCLDDIDRLLTGKGGR
ncbi:MAG: hypothetical protein U0800_08540 [Isosphaeraceae bacterium]